MNTLLAPVHAASAVFLAASLCLAGSACASSGPAGQTSLEDTVVAASDTASRYAEVGGSEDELESDTGFDVAAWLQRQFHGLPDTTAYGLLLGGLGLMDTLTRRRRQHGR